jgi:hypothetical protein
MRTSRRCYSPCRPQRIAHSVVVVVVVVVGGGVGEQSRHRHQQQSASAPEQHEGAPE